MWLRNKMSALGHKQPLRIISGERLVEIAAKSGRSDQPGLKSETGGELTRTAC
jgi:hypothetical protein